MRSTGSVVSEAEVDTGGSDWEVSMSGEEPEEQNHQRQTVCCLTRVKLAEGAPRDAVLEERIRHRHGNHELSWTKAAR